MLGVIIPEQKHPCGGLTLHGKPCKRMIRSDYCFQHVRLFKFEKPETCPVCYDSLDHQYQPLSCAHWICRRCIRRWAKPICPICRSFIILNRKERVIMITRQLSLNEPDVLSLVMLMNNPLDIIYLMNELEMIDEI